jgi:hypothetical protein
MHTESALSEGVGRAFATYHKLALPEIVISSLNNQLLEQRELV